MLKKILFFLFVLVILLIAMMIDNLNSLSYWTYSLYFIAAVATFGLGYNEIANVVKLGFGITRYQIFIRFTKALVMVVGCLWVIHVLASVFASLTHDTIAWNHFIRLPIVVFLTSFVMASGQLGMFFGNIRLHKAIGILGLFLVAGMMIIETLFLPSEWITASILLVVTIGLGILNYRLIKLLKIERS